MMGLEMISRSVERLAYLVVGAVVVWTIYRILRNRGVAGAAFGAPVRTIVDELELRHGEMRTSVRIDVLNPRSPTDGPHVGVEITRSLLGAREMIPLPLTRVEARLLATRLAHAADESATDAS